MADFTVRFTRYSKTKAQRELSRRVPLSLNYDPHSDRNSFNLALRRVEDLLHGMRLTDPSWEYSVTEIIFHGYSGKEAREGGESLWPVSFRLQTEADGSVSIYEGEGFRKGGFRSRTEARKFAKKEGWEL